MIIRFCLKPYAGIYMLVLLFLFSSKTGCQILTDEQSFENIRKGVFSIYNCEFDGAAEVSQYLERKYGSTSIFYLFKGMDCYWQNFPLLPGTKAAQIFEADLQKSIELAEEKLEANNNDAENLLSGLGSAGMLLLYYADNGLSGKVISLAPKTYHWVMRAFDFTEKYKDFYFITGLYNYYREAYASAHPIYKPVMIFFPHGNRKVGLQQLKISADSAVFLKAESMTFLSGIYLDFERDPAKAIYYSRKLRDTYPNNPEFRLRYIRDLLFIKKYGEAESLLNGMPYASLSTYFQAGIDILKGVIQEKRYKNLRSAEQLYWSGINKTEEFGQFAADYSSYGYFGLSRIKSRAGDNKASKQYRKKAKDLATFDHVNFD